MENNFGEVVNKFNDILKDKDIDLGKILNNDSNKNNENANNPQDDNTSNFDFDLNTIIKLKNIFGQINDSNSPRNNLLYSLKPFLREEKKEKLDQYIKIANLLKVLEIMNDMNE